MRESIPDFWPTQQGYYWGEVAPDVAERAVSLIGSEGLDAAVQLLTQRNPDLEPYLKEDRRIDWLFHCLDKIEPQSCLDVGSGWGSLSLRLSPFFREVWALDAVRARLCFQQAAAARLDLRNLHLVRSNYFPLPFPNDSFDLVVVNGVLEWVGLVDNARPVPELQIAFLHEIRRVLKPRGILYVGSENRYAFGNFAGARDHSGLPYTALLPRPLASLAVRWLRHPREKSHASFRTITRWPNYRTYTYSLWGYRNLMRQAGFATTAFAWAWPSYNSPWLSGDVETDASLSVFLDFMRTRAMVYLARRNRRQRLLRMGAAFPFRSWVAAALRCVIPSFLIFARPAGGDPIPLPALQISGTRKIVTVPPPDEGTLKTLKRPRFPQDEAALEEEEGLLLRYNTGLTARRLQLGKLACFEEPYLEGIAPDITSLSHQRRALSWLLRFQRKTQSGNWQCEEMKRQVLADLETASPALGKMGLQQEIAQGCWSFLQALREKPLARVAEHGDFWKGNLILQPPDRIFALDWQHFSNPGEPFFDFFFFLFSHYCYGYVYSPGPLFLRAYRRNAPFLFWEFSTAKDRNPVEVMAYLPYFTVRYLLRGTPLPDQIKPFGQQLQRWLERKPINWARQEKEQQVTAPT